jgi:acetoin utilization protein AcuB
LIRRNEPAVEALRDISGRSPESNRNDQPDRPTSLSIEDVDNELVQDWMTHDPVSIESSASLFDAYWLMAEYSIRRLPVIDDGILIGIVTLNDLRSYSPPLTIIESDILLSETLSEIPVLQLMTSDPKTIGPRARLVEAACMMLDNKISALPVVEDDQVIGIITESDIFRAMVELCPA